MKHYDEIQHTVTQPRLRLKWVSDSCGIIECRAEKFGGACVLYVLGLEWIRSHIKCNASGEIDIDTTDNEIVQVTVSAIHDFLSACELNQRAHSIYNGADKFDFVTHSFDLCVQCSDVEDVNSTVLLVLPVYAAE